jgi:hypothetical protein
MATAANVAAAPVAAGRRPGRLERSAITGVLVREVVNFSSYWKSTTFSSTVEPTIYLLAFGFVFGSLVSAVAGYSYVDFVGTGHRCDRGPVLERVPGHVRDVREEQVPAWTSSACCTCSRSGSCCGASRSGR